MSTTFEIRPFEIRPAAPRRPGAIVARVGAVATSGAIAIAIAAAGCAAEPESLPTPEWGTKHLSVLPSVDRTLPLEAADPSARLRAPREAAIDLLLQGADSTNPLLRANAVEALQLAPEAASPAIRLALGDDNRAVRFVAAMSVGRLRLRTLAPLAEPLLDDDALSVQAAAIFALRQCSRRVDLTPLAAMIMSTDPEVKGNAAIVLGELGDPSALPLLRAALRRTSVRTPAARRRIVELQIAEAMVMLGDDGELEVIRAALFMPEEEAELSVLAAQICGRLEDRAYASALFDMATRVGRVQEPPEVRLAAIEALARMGAPRVPVAVAVEHASSDRWELRMQAAATLGWCRGPDHATVLTSLMGDDNPLVQVAAAGAVLRMAGRP